MLLGNSKPLIHKAAAAGDIYNTAPKQLLVFVSINYRWSNCSHIQSLMVLLIHYLLLFFFTLPLMHTQLLNVFPSLIHAL